jgi:hypothetical protein
VENFHRAPLPLHLEYCLYLLFFSWHFACQIFNEAAISLFQGICAAFALLPKAFLWLNRDKHDYLLGRYASGSESIKQNNPAIF